MGEVAREGRTVLFVSHNMGAVSSLCSKCIWLHEGKLESAGETERIIGFYIDNINKEMPGGFADLRGFPRSLPLNNRHAEFEWVRTLNSKGIQTDTFVEGEPIAIEIGFHLKKNTHCLQSGVSIGSVDGSVWLFTIPSPEMLDVAAGDYMVRLHIRPNYLRNGNYTLALKLFSDGTRQDTIGQILRFNIKPYLSSGDNSAYRHRWVAGYMRFDYEWEPIVHGYGIAA
jgi:lipopolysaccharide transport system ATP-binding protein